MKILAIRGQNLASLARSFEIDLAAGPLRDVGLFAITGPVGAGKSTLLDALCLALFDRTPRLSNRGGVLVGDDAAAREDWLRSNDPRTLLRRDATEGHAEVDFTGRDGVRYRARWAVRRARRRPDGRVQDQEMSLVDLDRNVVVAGGRKTEVLAAIELRLGLDFPQFCRSVLLAQGEFAAFLRAPADERARLLENLTGADVYRLLSRGAHERRKRLDEQLARLRAHLDAHELLDGAARKALEDEDARLQADLRTCGVAIELAQRYVTWHATAARRHHDEALAVQELDRAIAANDAAATRRAQHGRLRQGRLLLAHWQLAERRRREAAELQQAAGASASALAQNDAIAARAAAAAAAALRATLGVDGEPPPVVRDLPQWAATLGERAGAVARRAEVVAELPRLETAKAAAANALAAAQAALAAAESARGQADARAEAARAAGDDPELAEVGRRRRHLAAERDRLRRTRDLLAAVEARDALQRSFPALVAEREAASARLVQQRDLVDRLRAEAGLAGLRARLVAGEPCPLCGAREHDPSAVHGDEAVARAAQELAAAQERFDRAHGAVLGHEAAAAAAERAVVAAQAGAAATGLDAGAPAPDVEPWAARLAADERALAALEARAEAAAGELRAAVQAVRAVADRVVAAQRAERTAAAGHASAEEALAEARATVQQIDAALAAQDSMLGAAFAGVDDWRDRLARMGVGVVPHLQRVHDGQMAARTARARCEEARALHQRLLADGERAATEVGLAEEALAEAAAAAGVTLDEVQRAAATTEAALAAEADELAQLERAVSDRRTELRLRVEERKKHEAHERPELGLAEAQDALELARSRRDDLAERQVDVRARLAADDGVRKQRDEIAPRLLEAERQLAVWAALDDLIGSSTGDAFVVFAQGLTLDLLLVEANGRLAELARRYRLEKNPTGEMDFVVVDLDLGGTRRGLQSLSGGESFLVSLALALALATLAAPRARVETLLLDEGFGTLDSQHLEAALGALDTLQATGCQVGVISHVDGIAERIGAVVEVRPEGGGQSRVLARVR